MIKSLQFKLSIMIFAFVMMLSSCDSNKNKVVIAEKIRYDVTIKSPDPNYDWWIQNLVGPERDRLTGAIFSAAISGKLQVFDYFNKPITKDQVNNLLIDTVYKTIQESEPPYMEIDTFFVNKLTPKHVEKIRFLEKWTLDTVTMQIQKDIFGIAPIVKAYGQNDEFRGYRPLFWIYTNENFKKVIKEEI